MPTVRVIVVAYILAVVAILAYPYRFYDPLVCVPNTARDVDGNGIVDLGPSGLLVTQRPIPQMAAIAQTDHFTIEVWAAANALMQGGPARIVTYSANPWARNFTLGQVADSLVIRLRTTATDLNGKPDFVVPAVFNDKDFQYLAVTFRRGVVEVYRNGDLLAATRAFAGSLSVWDPAFRLALGNEVTGARAWDGEISYAAFHAEAFSAEIIRQRSKTGPPASPDREDEIVLTGPGQSQNRIPLVRPVCIPIESKPFLSFFDGKFVWIGYATDVVLNILLFLPFGLLVTLGAKRGGAVSAVRVATVVLLAVVLSSSLESLQFYLVERDSSLIDVVTNALGALIGAILVACLHKSLA